MAVLMPAPRLRRLPSVAVCGRQVPSAIDLRSRLLGLAWLDRDEAGAGLLIPRCSSVHTFGMRFALDLVFLDGNGAICSVRRKVPPRRFASDRRAAAVLELPAESAICGRAYEAEGGEFPALRP
jgi:uncharacterized protein